MDREVISYIGVLLKYVSAVTFFYISERTQSRDLSKLVKIYLFTCHLDSNHFVFILHHYSSTQICIKCSKQEKTQKAWLLHMLNHKWYFEIQLVNYWSTLTIVYWLVHLFLKTYVYGKEAGSVQYLNLNLTSKYFHLYIILFTENYF